MPFERSPSSHGRLVVRDGPDELPSSLIKSPGSPCCSHRASLSSSSLCAQGLLRMSSGWLPQNARGGVIWARGFVANLLQVCLELGFHLLLAQAADVEFLLGIACLLLFGFKLQSELAANEAVISVALCTRHHFCT